MATRLYLRSSDATGVVPNAKQSGDTIYVDVASSYATYAVPADMSLTTGSSGVANSASGGTQQTLHYTHYGNWVSPAFTAARTISGTVTIGLSMTQTHTAQNNFPRVYIYKWLANDTKGTDLLALTNSGTEIGTSYSLVTYFSGVSITETSFAVGDRIVIEVESSDTANTATARVHGIQFNGADGGASGSYLEFSQTFTFGASTSYQDVFITGSITPSLTTHKSYYHQLLEITGSLSVSLSNLYALIQRKTGIGGTYADLVKTNWDTKAYSDTTVVAGNTYYYRMREVIDGVERLWSNEDWDTYPSGGTFYQNVFITGSQVPSLLKRPDKHLSITATTSPSVSRKIDIHKVFEITAPATPLIKRGMFKILSITGSITPFLNALKVAATYYQNVFITGVITPSLTKTARFYRTISITGIATPALTRLIDLHRTIAITASNTISLSRKMYKSLSISAVFDLYLSASKGVKTYYQDVFITGSLTPALTQLSTHYRTIQITASATPSLIRRMYRNLFVTASAVPSLVKRTYRTFAITVPLSISLSKMRSVVLSITQPATISLKRGMYKVISVSASVTPFLQAARQAATFYADIFITGVITPALSRKLTLKRSLSISAITTPFVSRKITIKRTIAAIASVVPFLGTVTNAVVFEITAAISASLSKTYGELQRNTNGGAFYTIAKVSWGAHAYADRYVFTPGITYCYRLRRVVDDIHGAWTNIDCVAYATHVYYQTLEIPASLSVSLSKFRRRNQLLAITANVSVSLGHIATHFRTFSITAAIRATLSRIHGVLKVTTEELHCEIDTPKYLYLDCQIDTPKSVVLQNTIQTPKEVVLQTQLN